MLRRRLQAVRLYTSAADYLPLFASFLDRQPGHGHILCDEQTGRFRAVWPPHASAAYLEPLLVLSSRL